MKTIRLINFTMLSLLILFIISGCTTKMIEPPTDPYIQCNQGISVKYGVEIRGALNQDSGIVDGGIIYDQKGNRIPMNTEHTAKIMKAYTNCLTTLYEERRKDKKFEDSREDSKKN